MQPQNFDQNSTPIPAPDPIPTPNTQHDKPHFSRKILFILIGITIIIVAAIVGYLLMNNSGDKNSQDKTTLYHDREGYQHRDGIGDPLSLVSSPTDKVVKVDGKDVVQSCALATPEDIRQANLKLVVSNTTGSITRSYFDGVGPTKLKLQGGIILPFDEDSNNCNYSLEPDGNGHKGVVSVTTYQPGYANTKVTDYVVQRKFKAAADAEGLKVFKEDGEEDRTTYMLRGNNVDVQLRLDTSDAAAKTTLLHSIAKKMVAAQTTPTPIQKFEYKSPIFTGKALDTCDFIDNDMFKAIHGVDSGALVLERYATAVGVIRIGDGDKAKSYNYAPYACERSVPDGISSRSVTIETDTYESSEAAHANFEREKTGPFSANVRDITPALGDESFFGDVPGGKNNFVIRKGRVIVRTSYHIPNQEPTVEERIQKLTPLLKSAIDKKLKDF